jgi:general stress protein CsbA
MEHKVVLHHFKQNNRGQTWGGILTVIIILSSLWLAYTGHDWLAGIFGTTTILGVLVIFVLHKDPNKKSKAGE